MRRDHPRPLTPGGLTPLTDAAALLLRALPGVGTRVPQDVAVCGFNDIPWAWLLSPSPTTVAQPAREPGGLAVEEASDLPREVGDIILPVRLVVQEPTARAPER
ncbi:substrate-binding domain-containing protein [Actinomyces israelii]|uniref:substrate-binding domain-containing protein n=1 Tax=Actinomyces israelii TaxID=1659 RepID=UPI002553A0BE|nr:substrate-binding domain-containing protein [Actinomyces israelii]